MVLQLYKRVRICKSSRWHSLTSTKMLCQVKIVLDRFLAIEQVGEEVGVDVLDASVGRL